MDIFPIVSKYGFRKRNKPSIKKTLDVEFSNLDRSVKNVNENNLKINTRTKKLNLLKCLFFL